jgi:large subunit ribosomal protein L25
METVVLEVKTRDAGSARAVRSEGLIPCNYYGLGKENKIFAVDYQTFRRVFEKAGGNTVIELDIDGKDKINVLVQDVDQDPVTDKFTHIDFKFVDLNKEITTEIPLVATGESRAVRELAGTLMINRDVLTVKCMAKNIPHEIEFDISPLEDFHHSIHVGDIKLPEGVEALDDEKLTIATVVAPRAEEEAPAETEEAAEQGEAEGKASEAKEESKEDGEKGE